MQLKEALKKFPRLADAGKLIEATSRGDLYPPQAEALPLALAGKNLVLCAGTGSGKTLVAELAAIQTVLERGKKVLYVVPYRALAGEKADAFGVYADLGIKTALSLGNLDSADKFLEKADIIVATAEKLDSLLRHKAPWIPTVGLLVVDEIHEIGSDRGPTLEVLITKLRRRTRLQILGLSATVGNAAELATWLGAELVESDFRPVPLFEGVCVNRALEFRGKEGYALEDEEEKGVLEDTLKREHQCLMFLNTRRSAEAAAERAAEITRKFLTKEQKEKLTTLAAKLEHVLATPTAQCNRLAETVKLGAAFHHAGLLHEQKVAIEQAFREGTLLFIGATITLVAGVNLPAHRIILKSLSQWSEEGQRPWPVSLYKQAVGRAGRPGFDKEGESIVIAKDESEAEEIWENYVNGEVEEIFSRLGSAPVLRFQVLGSIASGEVRSYPELVDFFGATFYSHQYGDTEKLERILEAVVIDLEAWRFLERSDKPLLSLGELQRPRKLVLTPLGRRVAELFLDPLTAHELIEQLKKQTTAPGYLVALCDTTEMRPNPTVKRREEEELWGWIGSHANELLAEPPQPWDLRADQFLKAVKAVVILLDWTNEKSEADLFEIYGTTPGDLRNRLVNIDWVAYAASELARLIDQPKVAEELRQLRSRLEHGVKAELLPLVAIRGIGRVRGRRLFTAGIRTPASLKTAPISRLEELLGKKVTADILAALKAN